MLIKTPIKGCLLPISIITGSRIMRGKIDEKNTKILA
jgi:hypothetical protein